MGVGELEVRNGYEVGFWKKITREWETIPHHALFIVRDGRRVRFVRTSGAGSWICVLSLFSLVVNQEAIIEGVWDGSRVEPWRIVPCFSRSLNYRELEDFESFMLLFMAIWYCCEVDAFVLKESKDGYYEREGGLVGLSILLYSLGHHFDASPI